MCLRVVEAVPNQATQIIDMLLEMHAECPLPLGTPSRSKIAGALSSCTKLVALDGDDYLAGILALREGEWWFSKERFIGDLVFYVRPSHRASRAAVLLLREAKKLAKMKDLPLFLGVMSGVDVERKDKLYARCGFTRVGGSYQLKDT